MWRMAASVTSGGMIKASAPSITPSRLPAQSHSFDIEIVVDTGGRFAMAVAVTGQRQRAELPFRGIVRRRIDRGGQQCAAEARRQFALDDRIGYQAGVQSGYRRNVVRRRK